MVLLAAILFPSIGRARASAGRSLCDVRLKAIALALNAHRQENGQYPSNLASLSEKKYLTEPLRCSNDPRQDGSYEDFYVVRAPRSNSERPILVCPFHEQVGSHGEQAYASGSSYTKQFTTRPAVLELANSVTLLRPGKNPIAATSGMALYGGDRLQTGGSGMAKIRFADTSVAELAGGTDITVLQSFMEGQSQAPLYSLVRQKTGEATYTVNHGSKFDVVTPTTTAGALGTKFKIVVDDNGNTTLTVIEGQVYVTTLEKSALAVIGTVTAIIPSLPGLPTLPSLPGL